MIQIRKGHSRDDGGCVVCDRYHTPLGTAAHEVNVYTIGRDSMAVGIRLCAFCEDDLRTVMPPAPPKILEGTQPADYIQRAFVEGAKWWQFHHNGSTMFSSERHEAEAEAVRKYGEPEKESGAV